ncbi:period circadian protein-like 3 [Silurus asotus]|uniref:Period circadian protein-like 3 n=1 Tax=Silurus asotus TaxID=30991 RepID=A0AAD5FP44_SILAS|nr:period circadian protein-like 3 [Silurus asotus]
MTNTQTHVKTAPKLSAASPSAAKRNRSAPVAEGPGASGAGGSNRRLQQTQAQVDEVVDIMRVNVDKVLERDQKLSELDDRADALQAGASQFETNAAKLKRKYWWKNCKNKSVDRSRDKNKPRQHTGDFGHVTIQSMPSGESYQDGEENGSLDPSCTERDVPADREAKRASKGGSSSSGLVTGSCDEEPSGEEQGQEDVEMNGSHESIRAPRQRSSLADGSPGSTTGSASTKSSKSATGSSSCSLHSAAGIQSRHHADCSVSEQAEQGRDHTHQAMMQTVQEMKKRLPSEKRSRSKPTNSEYYKLLMCNGLEERKDATVCTLEQLESITSEHTLKNTVQGMSGEEEHPCCLALAERIISGYEAPRIPTDKRIFTTTHSPGCVFLEVDDRAVPLLGYLPQDLVGTSVLTCLHPEDRALMLAMHRKILKYAGQPPFEHSPIRLRCQNGDYVTLDTSWSSFVNPWSRKVAFIIGRHKVRTGPLNEDVFATRNKAELPIMHEDVKELQAMIYKLFLQPVHTNGSSGYGSLGSNGSHEHYISVASSSDSNGNLWDDSHRETVTLQQICANVNKVKSGGQQAYLHSRRKTTAVGKNRAEPAAPILHDDQHLAIQRLRSSIEDSHRKQPHIPSYQQINCVDSIIRYLESCSGPALKRKSQSLSIATSSSSTTSEEDKTPVAPLVDRSNADEVTMKASAGLESQVSVGSAVTVAHTTAAVVGAPLTDITLSTKAMSVVSVTSQCSYSSTIVHVPQPESEVTALEDTPIGSEPADPAPAPSRPTPGSSTTAQEEFQVVGLTKEVLSAHTQKEEQEYVDRFKHRILESPFSSYLQQDNGSMAHSNHRGDYAMRPVRTRDLNRSHSGKPRHKRAKPQVSSDSDGSRPGHFLPITSCAPNNSSSETSQPKPSYFSPMLMPIQPPYYPIPSHTGAVQPHGVPMVVQQEQPQPLMQVTNPFMSPVMAVIMPYPANYIIYPQAVPGMPGVTPPGLVPPPCAQPSFMSIVGNPLAQTAPCSVPPASGALLSSPISSPWPEEDVDDAQPTALFSSSRSSSPLQLNLLQEELPNPNAPERNMGGAESLQEQHTKEDAPSDSGNQDAQSTSSVLLDLLLHEDARSGTGSNASGSGSGESGGSLGSGSGLGSNGTSTSHTGNSSNSSKYFASNDSSDTSRKARKSQDARDFDRRVEDSLWTMIQHTPEPVMMTYQIHPRDQAQVLKEDREKLLLLQPLQPWFTQEQKEELAEVHSWIHYHTVPEEINTQVSSSVNGCVSCNTTTLEESVMVDRSPRLPAPDSSTPQDCPVKDVYPNSDT